MIQTTGRCGAGTTDFFNDDFAVVRYNADELLTTVWDGGKVSRLSGASDVAWAALFNRTERYSFAVVVTSHLGFTLVRYNAK